MQTLIVPILRSVDMSSMKLYIAVLADNALPTFELKDEDFLGKRLSSIFSYMIDEQLAENWLNVTEVGIFQFEEKILRLCYTVMVPAGTKLNSKLKWSDFTEAMEKCTTNEQTLIFRVMLKGGFTP